MEKINMFLSGFPCFLPTLILLLFSQPLPYLLIRPLISPILLLATYCWWLSPVQLHIYELLLWTHSMWDCLLSNPITAFKWAFMLSWLCTWPVFLCVFFHPDYCLCLLPACPDQISACVFDPSFMFLDWFQLHGFCICTGSSPLPVVNLDYLPAH